MRLLAYFSTEGPLENRLLLKSYVQISKVSGFR
jgi:hypothetical protein